MMHKKRGFLLVRREFEPTRITGLIDVDTLSVVAWGLWQWLVVSYFPLSLMEVYGQDTRYYSLWKIAYIDRILYMLCTLTVWSVLMEAFHVNQRLRYNYVMWLAN
jgi:hypothetical protein